jgi:photosystem II protein PsbQ
MRSYRSILALILAVVTTFLVSCGSPTAKTPPTYSSEQIVQIQKFAADVAELRDKMTTLETKIQQRNWTDVGTYIHGPLGELRQKLSYLTRELLPQERKAAAEASKDLFSRLQNLNMAAEDGDYAKAVENYRAAVKEFDQFLRLIPGQKGSA